MLLTLWKASYEWWAWQLPSLKLPHSPSGVPKLANLTDEIFWPGPQDRWAFGLRGLFTFPEDCICQFIRVGCHSLILTHTLSTSLLTRWIPFGSPPHSSNTTNRFPVGFNQERGTWYLIKQMIKEHLVYPCLNRRPSEVDLRIHFGILLPTISEMLPRSYLSTSSHCMYQYNHRNHKNQLICKQASSARGSDHLTIFALSPYYPCLMLRANFPQGHWK